MAQKYYFFNSAPGDERLHQASDFARYFGNVLTSGLFSLDNQIGLRVQSDGTDMRSYVETGKALIKGFAYENDADEYLLHDLPEVTNNRIDRVVLRLDLRNQNRFIKVFVKSGVADAAPVPPELQRDNFIYELSLAQILVRANTSTINPADITDERLEEQLCGIVNSMITVPTSQFQDDWNAWYAANIPQYESEWQDFIDGLAGATFVQTVNGTGPDVNGNVEVAIDTTAIDAELDAMSAQIGILSEGKHKIFNVRNYGALGNDSADDASAIQSAIDAATQGAIVYLPPGIYRIGATIQLKEEITLSGAGWGTVIKIKNNANIPQALELVQRYDRPHNTIVIKDLLIDGNKSNNTSGHGMYLSCSWTSRIENVRVINVAQTGIFWDGNAQVHANTNYVRNCHVYGSGGFGVYFSEYCDDMHINGGDIGYNWSDAVVLNSPSSSIRNATVWGSANGNGVLVTQHAPSVQIMNNQIEGHAKHGVVIQSSHVFVNGNKIYDNANTPPNYGNFSGVFVQSVNATVLKNIAITANTIYSGLYTNTGYHKHAVEFADALHENATVVANALKYLGNDALVSERQLVSGLLAGDVQDVYPTVEKIEEVTLSVASAGVSFSNIRPGYKKLVILLKTGASGGNLNVSIDNILVGSLTNAASDVAGELVFYQPSGSGVRVQSSVVSSGGAVVGYSQSADYLGSISKITLSPSAGNTFSIGSTFALYGWW